MSAGLRDAAEPAEPWQHPSPRLRTMRRIEVSAVTLAAAALTGGLGGFAAGGTGAGIGVGAAAVAGLLADRLLQRRIRSWAYCEREDDLLVRRGIFVRRLSVIPYGRMQFVDVVAGPVERSFGLATVRMHTAAAASDARIPGLAEADAARLRDQLATLGEARAAGL